MSLEELITAARGGADAPTLADRERVRGKLAARIRVAGAAVPGASGSGRSGVQPVVGMALVHAQSRTRRTRWLVKALLVAAVLAVGTASAFEARRMLSGWTHARGSVETAPMIPLVTPVAKAEAPTAASSEAVPVLAPSPVPVASAPRVHADRPTSAASGATGDGLADELELVQQARAALHRGAPSDALAALDRRDARHPGGTLGQEAAALRILALCDLGRSDEARARGAAFLRSWPRSPMTSRIHGSCAAAPGAGK